MRKCMIIIFGPTGIGKTDFAESIAKRLPAEIVNADLGQFYTPLTIGTAKPDWHTSPIPQHLFDCINEPRMISVAEYRDQVMRTLEEIWNRNNIPIIVGGSGFYLKSLFFPPQVSAAVQNERELQPEADRWQQLYAIDPQRALRIHAHDLYRINRALAIYFATGKKPSDYMPRYQPLGSFCFVYLTRERNDLYARINQRVELMLKHGWIEEVARLQNTAWEPFLKRKKLIGYDDILEYLEGEKKLNEMNLLTEVIARKTRNYGKRQITFGNQLYEQLEKSLLETADSRSSCVRFDLTCGQIELYINQLLQTINLMHCFDNQRRENV